MPAIAPDGRIGSVPHQPHHAHVSRLVGWAAALVIGGAAVVARAAAVGDPSTAAWAWGAAAVWLAVAGALPARRWSTPLLFFVAATLAVAVPSGSHRAAVVALLATAAGAAALGRWRPLSHRPPGPRPIAWLALAPIVLAASIWYRSGWLGWPLLLLPGSLLITELADRRPATIGHLEHGIASVVRAVGNVVGTVLVAVVAVPLLYLPGAIARLADRLRRRQPALSTWTHRTVTPAEERRTARWPFAPTPPADRRRRTAVGLVLLALALLALANADRIRPRENVDSSVPTSTSTFTSRARTPFSSLPAYAGVPFADDLQAEQQRFAEHLPTDEVTGTTSGTFHGQFTNVTNGARTTLEPSCPGCPRATLWLVGGSTAFGLGQRDDHTIASDLVRLAQDDGIALTVRNLAVPGWTSWQERRAVTELLERPEGDHPDLIVSYGGYNDVAGAVTSAAVYGDDGPNRNDLDIQTVTRFVDEGLTVADAGGVDAISKVAAERYLHEAAAMADRARRHGASTAFFIQPDATATPRQLAPVADVYTGVPPATSVDLGAVLDRFAKEVEPVAVDLRSLYDGEPTSVYVDLAHTNERGATMAATALYQRLRASIRKAATS